MSRDFASTKSNTRTSLPSTTESNVLGRGLRVRGRLSGGSDLRIEGEIEGDVNVGGALELASTASVTGNVIAKSVDIGGALTGDVQSDGAVVIRTGARVTGDMNGAEVALEEGAVFTGRIEADFELPDGLGGESAVGGRGKRAGASRGR